MDKKEKDCKIKQWKEYWISHHEHYAVYLALFILFFISGIRISLLSALVIASVDLCFIISFVKFFNRLLNKKGFKLKVANYFLIAFIIFIFVNIVNVVEFCLWKYAFYEEIMNFFHDFRRWFPHIFFKDAFIVLGSFIASLITYSNQQRKKAEKLSYEKQAMELRFLKSQIKPHFVFNVLNNIYALAYTKSDQAPDVILQLADILRYTTDECQADTISVDKELKYIDNYIDLHIMRVGHTDAITFEYDIDDYSTRIPPMLLQPAIENSFKHSDFEINKDGIIYFCLKIKNKKLTFTTYNTKKQYVLSSISERKGVGLSNIEQRLQLYFGKDYVLKTEDRGDSYTLMMEIDLMKMNINKDEIAL